MITIAGLKHCLGELKLSIATATVFFPNSISFLYNYFSKKNESQMHNTVEKIKIHVDSDLVQIAVLFVYEYIQYQMLR